MTNPMNSGQFGLELPPICVYIKQILDEYPEGGQILKELLQNADDAGARNVIFLHDETNHPTDHLWKDSLKKFNGPALYVYNDATFTDKDWCNIQKPQQSGKIDDPTKVGQFGLGFISVYHITDMPSVLSGGYVGFFDPHEKHFVRVDPEEGVVDKRGKWWPISNELLQPEFKDQFRPFVNKLFGCTEDNFHKGAFPGTIFRFPLRNEESRISSVVYDGTRVSDLFHSFQNDAEISLLFLKSVESVSVYHKKHGLSDAKLLFKAGVSFQNRSQLRSDRFEFIKKIDEGRAISRSRIQIDSLSQSRGPTSTEYVIVNVARRSTSLHVLMQDKDVNYLPWVGVAAQTDSVTKGRTFCFLPLPEGEQTKLPVHVHGYLGLVKNRRSIKWPDHDSEHDRLARWNKQLIEDNLPVAYAEIIKEAIKRGLPSERVYQLWPKVDRLDGAWKKAVKTAVKKLKEEAILYSMDADGGSWRAPADVYIDTEHDPLIQKVLTHDKQRGYPVVHVPPHVVRALEWGGVTIRKVIPALIRRVVRNDPLHWLTRKERMSLLEYILEDEAFSDLEGIHLLPLQSHKFVAFSRRSMPIYLQNYAIPTDIFPDMESRLSSSDCPVQLKRATSSTQLKGMTTSDVPSILKESLPSDWVNGNGPSSIDWLKKLWTWLRSSEVSLDDLANLPLIPLRKTPSGAIYLARLCRNTLIYNKETRYGESRTLLSKHVSAFLESLGAVVITENPPEFVLKHREISTFIRSGNGKGVMCILEHLGKSTNLRSMIAKASADLKHDLASILSPEIHSFPSTWLQIIRQLPIFKATNGRYVTSTDCKYAVPSGLYGIPIQPKQLQTPCIVLDDVSSPICTKLGVQTLTKYNLVTIHILPHVGRNSVYSKTECDRLMTWVLENPEFDDAVKDVRFLLTSRQVYSRPCDLFAPDSWLLMQLLQTRPVFPTGIYATSGRLLLHLKRIGLRSESQVTPQELLHLAHEIAQAGDPSRSKVFLEYISQYAKKLYEGGSKSLGTSLSEIAWVSCECYPPSSYPTTAPWYGTSNGLHQPKQVKLIQAAPLVGSVAPLLDLNGHVDAFSKFFGWNDNFASSCSVNDVVTHLLNVSRSKPLSRNMGHMVDHIYKYMADKCSYTHYLQTCSELLKGESWVWHGYGFTKPEKIAFHSVIHLGNLKSPLFVVPPELQDDEHEQVKTMLTELGVKESFDAEDFLNIVVSLKLSYGDKSLSRADMDAVLEIIKALTSYEDLTNIHEQVLAPDSRGVLRQCAELVYIGDIECVEGDYSAEGFGGFMYSHDGITSHQAKLLGIRTCLEIRLDQCSDNNGFERPFGQHEKFTTRLRGILSEYSHNPDVLKELLQNADDSGASEIHVVYDPRKHDGAHISGEPWRPIHSLPAICVYNDKPFTEEDITGIQNVGVGGKCSDTTTTGRFGIGFNSVYLLSDCPTFLTQNMTKLCVFDPHVRYVPHATMQNPGQLYINDNRSGTRSFLKVCPDMTQGYLQEFKEFDLKNGTMFRFPLRPHGMESEISDKCYDNDQVHELLGDFEKVADEALLFLNNISKISISEIDQLTGKLKLRYRVSANVSPQDRAKRQELGTHLKAHKHLPMREIPEINRVYTIKMTDTNDKKEVWMISQSIGLDQSTAIPEENCEAGEFMTKSYLPRGGVAAVIHGPLRHDISGKAFCFLPLHSNTHLPVHVNGTFRLDHSRQNLKKGDKDPIHRWNKLLAMYVIAPAYAHLIVAARMILFKSPHIYQAQASQQFSCWRYDCLFPNLTVTTELRGIWKLIGISVLKYIGMNDLKVLPVIRNYDSKTRRYTVVWFGPTCSDDPTKGAFFDDLSKLDTSSSQTDISRSSLFRTFLQEIGFNLISCSAVVGRSFTSTDVGVGAEFISPESCREDVRETLAHRLPCRIDDTPFKTCYCLTIVMSYCLGGLNNVEDLQGLPFRLDGDGVLGIFSLSDPKYLSFDHSLLPKLQGKFLDIYVVRVLHKWFDNRKKEEEKEEEGNNPDIYHSGILKKFTIDELAKYMHTNFPPYWRNPTHHLHWNKGRGSLPQASWLQSLWNYISLSHTEDEPCDLQALADWPIIPSISGYLVSLRMSKTVLFPDAFESNKGPLLKVLQKLGCPLVDEEILMSQYIPSSSKLAIKEILRTYLVGPNSRNEVLNLIKHMVQMEKRPILTGVLKEDECDTLLRYIQEDDDKLSAGEMQTIKQLPLFSLIKTGSRESIEKYTHSYTIEEEINQSSTLALVETISSVTFLKHNNHLEKLYEMLGIVLITLPRIYIKFILQTMKRLSLSDRLRHVKFIRDEVVPLSSEDEIEHMYRELSQVPFIKDLNGEVKTANRFFDPTNEVFSMAVDQIHLLPSKFQGYQWRQFLIDIGLKYTVTKELIIMFARSVEEKAEKVVDSEAITTHLKNLSERLICELQRNEDLLDGKTLSDISEIEFVPSVRIDALYPNNGIKTAVDISDFICFRGAIPEEHKTLTWTVAPLIASTAVPCAIHELNSKEYPWSKIGEINIHRNLRITTVPNLKIVLQHTKILCTHIKAQEQNTLRQNDELDATARMKLIETIPEIMGYLKNKLDANNETPIKKGLQQVPICIVGDNEDKLVRANQLVFDMSEVDKATEGQLRPYLYRAPRHLGGFDKLLSVLGTEKEPTFQQLLTVLDEIHDRCHEEPMDGGESMSAYAAVRSMLLLLLKTRDSDGGGDKDQDNEGGEVNLYLPTTENKLRPSTSLYYTDRDEIELPGRGENSDLVAPLRVMFDGYSIPTGEFQLTNYSELIDLLPNYLRPMKIVTHEKPLDTNAPCNGGEQCSILQQMKELVQSEDLQIILLRIIYHQTGKDPSELKQQKIADLRKFDGFVCVQELRTAYFNSQGECLGNRPQSRDILLTSSGGDSQCFVIHIGHTDISEDTESGSIFFLPLAESIDHICKLGLDKYHVCILKDVLVASPVQRSRVLKQHKVPEYQHLITETLGSIIPEDICRRLHHDVSYRFQLGEVAAYIMSVPDDNNDGDVQFIYVKILDIIADDMNEESESIHYKIDKGGSQSIVVSVDKLFHLSRSAGDLARYSDNADAVLAMSSGFSSSSAGRSCGHWSVPVPLSYSSYISRSEPVKAKLWQRQAREDFETVQAIFLNRNVRVASLAWQAFILHQAAEKALKAAIFQLHGNQSMTHNLLALVSDVNAHSSGERYASRLRGPVGELLQLGCDPIRPRYPEYTQKTTGEVYKALPFQTAEALEVCKSILEIVDELLGSSNADSDSELD